MEQTNTKEQILDVALELFSVRGYEATSISQIAEAVGIRKASLYSHYDGKQAILDALVKKIIDEYNRHSMFAKADWDNPNFTRDKQNMTAEEAAAQVKGQIRYILHDPKISQARKMAVIEQFANPELSRMQTQRNYTDVMSYHTGMMRFLMKNGTLKSGDAELMAAEYCLPISVWLNLCDREPEREAEVMALIEKHILHFFELHKK